MNSDKDCEISERGGATSLLTMAGSKLLLKLSGIILTLN
jgi:hypothetical protein